MAAAANSAPEVVDDPAGLAVAGRTYHSRPDLKDSDGDKLTCKLTTSPPGMKVDSTCLVTWTPAAGTTGDHDVIIAVSDGKEQTNVTYDISMTTIEDMEKIDKALFDVNSDKSRYRGTDEAAKADGGSTYIFQMNSGDTLQVTLTATNGPADFYLADAVGAYEYDSAQKTDEFDYFAANSREGSSTLDTTFTAPRSGLFYLIIENGPIGKAAAVTNLKTTYDIRLAGAGSPPPSGGPPPPTSGDTSTGCSVLGVAICGVLGLVVIVVIILLVIRSRKPAVPPGYPPAYPGYGYPGAPGGAPGYGPGYGSYPGAGYPPSSPGGYPVQGYAPGSGGYPQDPYAGAGGYTVQPSTGYQPAGPSYGAPASPPVSSGPTEVIPDSPAGGTQGATWFDSRPPAPQYAPPGYAAPQYSPPPYQAPAYGNPPNQPRNPPY